MDVSPVISKKKSGQQLVNAERNVLISKLVDYLCEGYMSTNSLARKMGVSRVTIEKYRPLADELIGKMKLDRNVIRNLQIRRTYELIEQLMSDLKAITPSIDTVKPRAQIYANIFKFSSHLALITGLNVETTVNIDPQKLVIIRSGNSGGADTVIDAVPGAISEQTSLE